MSSSIVLIALVVAWFVGRALYQDFTDAKRKINRALARRPPSRIVDLTDGLVRITGRAHPSGELLQAPVTNRPCVAYHLKIDLWVRRGWSSLIDDRKVSTFAVRDGTGEAIVDPDGPISLALVPDASGSDPCSGTVKCAPCAAWSTVAAS